MTQILHRRPPVPLRLVSFLLALDLKHAASNSLHRRGMDGGLVYLSSGKQGCKVIVDCLVLGTLARLSFVSRCRLDVHPCSHYTRLLEVHFALAEHRLK